jgi:hypothetical protein
MPVIVGIHQRISPWAFQNTATCQQLAGGFEKSYQSYKNITAYHGCGSPRGTMGCDSLVFGHYLMTTNNKFCHHP